MHGGSLELSNAIKAKYLVNVVLLSSTPKMFICLKLCFWSQQKA